MHPTRQKVRRLALTVCFLLLPVTLNYYSPYLMTSGTAERVASFSLFFWTAIFVTAPLVGRVFCGWACPFNGLQTAWEQVTVRPLKRVPYLPAVKYALWGLWAAAVVGLAAATGGWKRVDPFYMTEHVVSIDAAGNLVTYYLLVGITLAPTLLGRRGFCRYFCPFGVWSIVGEKLGHAIRLPRVRLVADSARCTACASCDRSCPMQLPVSEMVASGTMRTTECFACGSCRDGCRQDVIRWTFGS